MLGTTSEYRIAEYLPDVLKGVFCRGRMPFLLHRFYHAEDVRNFQM